MQMGRRSQIPRGLAQLSEGRRRAASPLAMAGDHSFRGETFKIPAPEKPQIRGGLPAGTPAPLLWSLRQSARLTLASLRSRRRALGVPASRLLPPLSGAFSGASAPPVPLKVSIILTVSRVPQISGLPNPFISIRQFLSRFRQIPIYCIIQI